MDGMVTFTDKNGSVTKVDKSWGYKKDGDGVLRIVPPFVSSLLPIISALLYSGQLVKITDSLSLFRQGRKTRMIDFKTKDLKGDLFGGLTAGIVALPLALAFGEASGAGQLQVCMAQSSSVLHLCLVAQALKSRDLPDPWLLSLRAFMRRWKAILLWCLPRLF